MELRTSPKVIVDGLERFTSGTRARKEVYAMSAAKGDAVPRTIGKAVYCTCWDGDIKINVSINGTTRVTTSR